MLLRWNQTEQWVLQKKPSRELQIKLTMSILGSVYYLPLPPINSQRWRKLEESESWLSCNLSQPSPPFVSVIPTSRMLNIIPYIPQLPINILYKSRGGWIFWGWTRLLRWEHTVYQSTHKIWGRKRIFHTGTEKSKHIKGWSELHYRVGSGEWGWSLS